MFQLWQQIIFSDESSDFLLYFMTLLYYFNISVEICRDSVAKGLDALQMSMLIKFFW